MSIYGESISLLLTRPGTDPLTIGCDGSMGLRSLDRGWPQVRSVVQNATGQDGSIDRTQHFGARVVSASVYALRSTFAEHQLLRSYLAPSRRSILTLSGLPGGAPPLQAEVRGAALAATLTQGDLNVGAEAVACQWIVPTGIFESVTERIATLQPSGTGPVPGRAYDLTFPRDYPSAPVDGAKLLTNEGAAVAYPIHRVFGPIDGPTIQNLDTGAAISLPDLDVEAGNYVEIDTRNRTVRYNGDPNDSRRNLLDFTTSSWWGLDTGEQRLRLTGTNTQAATQAIVTWRDAYL